jgi:hypothetical protein
MPLMGWNEQVVSWIERQTGTIGKGEFCLPL